MEKIEYKLNNRVREEEWSIDITNTKPETQERFKEAYYKCQRYQISSDAWLGLSISILISNVAYILNHTINNSNYNERTTITNFMLGMMFCAGAVYNLSKEFKTTQYVEDIAETDAFIKVKKPDVDSKK